MKKVAAKLGLPVVFALAGYVLVLVSFAFPNVIDINLFIWIGMIICFISSLVFSGSYIFRSKKKNIKREVAMNLFQKGIWGFLLSLPWILFMIFSALVMSAI